MMNDVSKEMNPDQATLLSPKIIGSLPIPVFYRNLEGVVVLCNESFARMFKMSRDNIHGKRLSEVMLPAHGEILMRKDKELLETGSDQHYEATLTISGDEVHELIINKSAIAYENGELCGISGSLIDVTERRRLEQQLHFTREEMKISTNMLQKIRAGIVIVDKDLKILDSNIGFARMIGEENEELFETIPGLKGADLEMLVPEVISKMFKAIIETGESRLERDIKYQNKLLSIGVMTIHKHKVAGAIIRDMSAPMLERAEIIERARQVNRKNMKTVQQIAFLLGENAAQTEELLNSIIESQKYEVDENQ